MAVKKKNIKRPSKHIAESNLEVNEPVEMYGNTIYAGRKEYQNNGGRNSNVLLIGSARKPENQMTSFEKMKIVHSGLSKKDLESLKTKTKLDYGNLAKALSVTRATLINKKKQQKFSTVLSERIMSLADIYSYGYEVFGDEDRFNQWMFHPNRALNGQAPYELMDNQYGRQEVRDIIGRIDYGVYS